MNSEIPYHINNFTKLTKISTVGEDPNLPTRRRLMSKFGDLSLQHPIGSRLLCVQTADPTPWLKYAPDGYILQLPQVGMRYVLTAHVVPCALTEKLLPYSRGVRVSEILGGGRIIPLDNKPLYNQGMPLGEPFFLYNYFSVISRP